MFAGCGILANGFLRVRCECGLTRYRVLARNASRYAWAAEV